MRDPEAVARAKRNYLLRHPERRKASQAKYYAKNSVRENERVRRWERANYAHFRAHKNAYRRRRYAAGLETPDAWLKANPEKVRAYKAATRARRLKAKGIIPKDIVPTLMKSQRRRCNCCKARLTRYHLDHIRSLTKGGTNYARNLQLLCPPCNQQKSDKPYRTFLRERERRQTSK